ncbi:MAG TPA: glycosyltransferase family 39 protein [Anaerolineaceae bacterium]
MTDQRAAVSHPGLLAALFVCCAAAIGVGIAAYAMLPANISNWVWLGIYIFLIAAVVVFLLKRQYRLLVRIFIAINLAGTGYLLVFSGNGPALFAWTWLGALSLGIGMTFLEWLKINNRLESTDQILVGSTLGLCALALLAYLLGSAGTFASTMNLPVRFFRWLDPLPVFAALLLLSGLAVPALLRSFRDWQHPLKVNLQNWWKDPSPAAALLTALFSLCLWGLMIWALSPTIRYDSLVYHLAAPEKYVENRALLEITEPMHYYMSHYGEMLFTLAMVVAGQPLPNLIHLLSGFLLAGFTLRFGVRLGNRRVGWIAAALLVSMPIYYDAATAHNDFFVALFGFAALYLVFHWTQSGVSRWLWIAGIMAGFSIGVKVNGAVTAVIGFLAILAFGIYKRMTIGQGIKHILLFAIPVGVAYLPWALLNAIWIHNPFYPFLCSIFPCPLSGIDTPLGNNSFIGKLVSDYLLLFWNTTFYGQKYYIENFGGAAGGIFLFSLPWFLLTGERKPSRRAILLTILTSASILLSLPFTSRTRYILPIIPLLCILSAFNFEAAWQAINQSRLRRGLGITAALTLALYFLITRLVFTTSGWQIAERYPYKVALGLETPTAFLSQSLPVYDALQYLNKIGDGRHKVVSVGNETRMYTYSEIHTVYYSSEIHRIINAARSPADLAQGLKDASYTYLIEDRIGIRDHPAAYDLPLTKPEFLNAYARLIFSRKDILVYQLFPDTTAKPATPGENLLVNPGFESFLPEGMAAGWMIYQNPQFGTPAHSGKSAVLVSDVAYVYQRQPVKGNTLYTLGHWSRAENPAGVNIRLQITWLDRTSRPLEVTIKKAKATSTWAWNQLSFSAPENAVIAQVNITTDDTQTAWFDDICFTEGPTCK